MFITLFIATFSALFSVVNPLGAMPVFLALTGNDTPEWRNKQLKKACLFLSGILIVFFLLGSYILNFFGITIEGMRIAGGIIITHSGLDLLQSNAKYAKNRAMDKKAKQEAKQKTDISFSPLAMPMLSGPGSISLLISMALEHQGYMNNFVIILSVLAVAIVCYLILRVSPKVMSVLGETGSSALSRMMGFIVLAIGIQFITNGIVPILKSIFA